MKHKFTYEWEQDINDNIPAHKVTSETDADSLGDVISCFAGYLKACGFSSESVKEYLGDE